MVEMDHVSPLELEDDLFFADLSQRIALLIMDDDGGETEALRSQRRPSSLQGSIMPPRQESKHQTTTSERCFRSLEGLSSTLPAMPSQVSTFHEQAAYGRRPQVRGTGVFIPQFSLPPAPGRKLQRGAGGKSGHSGGKPKVQLVSAAAMGVATKGNKSGGRLQGRQQQSEVM